MSLDQWITVTLMGVLIVASIIRFLRGADASPLELSDDVLWPKADPESEEEPGSKPCGYCRRPHDLDECPSCGAHR